WLPSFAVGQGPYGSGIRTAENVSCYDVFGMLVTKAVELRSAGQPRAPAPQHAKSARAGDPGAVPTRFVASAIASSAFARMRNFRRRRSCTTALVRANGLHAFEDLGFSQGVIGGLGADINALHDVVGWWNPMPLEPEEHVGFSTHR